MAQRRCCTIFTTPAIMFYCTGPKASQCFVQLALIYIRRRKTLYTRTLTKSNKMKNVLK